MSTSVEIAVVGSGYVGLVAAVCFAEMGHHVTCVDNDPRKVAALQGGDSLIHEEHLPELLQRYRNTRVHFTTDLGAATAKAEAIFIAVGTPQSETGDADLSYVEAVACEIARHLDSYKVIVEKSTVPVYTNEWIRRSIERNGVDRKMFDVVSNPEFLREGSAVSDFLHPDRIVVGADSERAAAVLQAIYAPLTDAARTTLSKTSSPAAFIALNRHPCSLLRRRVRKSSSTLRTHFSRSRSPSSMRSQACAKRPMPTCSRSRTAWVSTVASDRVSCGPALGMAVPAFRRTWLHSAQWQNRWVSTFPC